MIDVIHSTVANVREFVRNAVARACAFYRTAVERARALLGAILRFPGD